MLPYQLRVLNEKTELDKKVIALDVFIGNDPVFETLSAEEQKRMKDQLDVMKQYSEILWARISAF